MNFHEVLFPAALSFGSSGGPERRTEVVTLASGFEERNSTWAHSRRFYDAGLGLRSADDIHEVLSFFEARLGKLIGFRWRDWADHKSCAPSADISSLDQEIGIGDGNVREFPLSKAYLSGPASYSRPISKPVAGSVRVAIDGTEITENTDYSVDHSTGLISLGSAPGAGQIVSAGFTFHVPVRFDTDRIDINLASFEAGEIPSIPVVEVRI